MILTMKACVMIIAVYALEYTMAQRQVDQSSSTNNGEATQLPEPRKLRLGDQVYHLRDGLFLIIQRNGARQVWDYGTTPDLHQLLDKLDELDCLTILAERTRLVAGSASGTTAGQTKPKGTFPEYRTSLVTDPRRLPPLPLDTT